MIVNLKKINYYFLTTRLDQKKSDHVVNMLSDYNLTEINPPLGIGKQRSGSIGHSMMIDNGLKDQNDNKEFQPFIILEDDISCYRESPTYLNIPKNTDLLYVGISACGIGNGNSWNSRNILYADEVSNDVVRIYNMLSTHAIMICSKIGANMYKKSIMSGNNIGWDIPVAKNQPYYNIYALKYPLFYQDKKYGGIEWATKISLQNNNIIFNTKPTHLNLSIIYKSPPKK